MSGIHETWTVLPHGPLIEIDQGILTVTGEIHMPLVDLERRMTVVKLRDGSAAIYSAVALEDAEMGRIEAFGDPAYLIVPNPAHRLDAKIFKQRYPSLRVVTPPGARKRVEKIVPVDSTGDEFSDPDVRWQIVDGAGELEGALLVRRNSGTTLLLSDLIGNLRRRGGFEGWLLHVMGFGGDDPQIPAVEKALMVKNKARLRQQFLQWAAMPDLRRIIMSHGEPIETDPAGALRKLADTLAD